MPFWRPGSTPTALRAPVPDVRVEVTEVGRGHGAGLAGLRPVEDDLAVEELDLLHDVELAAQEVDVVVMPREGGCITIASTSQRQLLEGRRVRCRSIQPEPADRARSCDGSDAEREGRGGHRCKQGNRAGRHPSAGDGRRLCGRRGPGYETS